MRRSAGEHALLVVAGHARRARAEQQLAAVHVDVAAEEGDLVVVGGALDVAHELVQRVRGGGGAVAADERVRPAEAQEGDGDDPMLRRLLARRRRCARSAVDRQRPRASRPACQALVLRRGLASPAGAAAQEPAAAARGAERARREEAPPSGG